MVRKLLFLLQVSLGADAFQQFALLMWTKAPTKDPLHVCLGAKSLVIIHLEFLLDFWTTDQSVQSSQQATSRSPPGHAITHGPRQQLFQYLYRSADAGHDTFKPERSQA